MYKFLALLLVALISGGCSGLWGERGNRAWCNDRYLYKDGKDGIKKPFADELHLNFAKRGYMYAVAGALVLQKAGEDRDFHFGKPPRLKLIDDPPIGEYGFDVKSFDRLDRSTGDVEEVIVAFVGSNDKSDWIWTNFLFSQEQHSLARDYIKTIAQRRPGKRIVVTGYSLGGALATHVAKHKDTRDLISEAWAFNPSPKTWVSGETDKRIWLGAARNEVLSSSRGPFFAWLPGINKIGAPPEQTAEDFYLINTSGIYGHFRWVLARSMLHMADYDLARNNELPITEPLEILKLSDFKPCIQQGLGQ